MVGLFLLSNLLFPDLISKKHKKVGFFNYFKDFSPDLLSNVDKRVGIIIFDYLNFPPNKSEFFL